MKSFYSFKRLVFIMLFCFAGIMSKAQTSPVASGMGYSIWESASLSSPLSGQPFTYNVFFTLPAGAGTLFITAYLPSQLVIDAVTAPPTYAGNAYSLTTLPGNAVRLTFPAPISGNISGSFQVHVHFPYLGACNRTVVSWVELKSDPISLITERISTNCVVDKTWHLQKYSVGTTYVGTGNSNGCNYQKVDSLIEYGVRMVRSSSQIWGSYSLTSAALSDAPSSGGIIQNGLTYTSPALAGSTLSGGSFGLSTSVFDPASAYELRFKVKYPTNGCVNNVAKLTGVNGCGQSVTFTDTARVAIVNQLPVSSTLIKSVVTAGNLPGCTGTYIIRVYNNGSVPVNYVLRDTFPVCLGTSVAVGSFPSGGSSVAFTSGTPSIATMNGVNLAGFGAFHTYTFTFTIGTGCGTSFTNKVWADAGFAPPSQATAYLLPPGAIPCIKKTVCNNAYLFNVGDTVRFRLRVQNIGGTPISGGVITDSLDLNNLSYIGNESHYYANNAYTNYPCNPALTPISGSGPYQWGSFSSTYNSSTGVIKWGLPVVPVQCSSISYPVCESAWNAPAYYIEFDVKIKDTAGIGNVFNRVMIDGGNIVTPAVGFVSIITKGYINYAASKEVSTDAVSYAAAATAPAGSLVYYKLVTTNYGIAIRNATLVDLLPMDNGGTDNFILWNGNRSPGGNFNIRYNAPYSSTHTSTADSSSVNAGIKTTYELGVTVNSNPPGWIPGLAGGSTDIKTRLTQQIGSSPLNYIFSAKVAADAKENETVCNTYALKGFAKYLQNALVNYMPLGALESSKACVTATQSDPCCKPYDIKVPSEICFGTSAEFCILDSCKDGEIEYTWDFGDGSPQMHGNCVTHAYTAEGTYSVTIKWKNACGEDGKKFEVTVKECPCKVEVSFKLSTSGYSMTADGTSTVSSQPIAAYVWDYGDGTYGTGAVSTHNYSADGSYLVTLTVYSIDSKGNICECRGKCTTEIFIEKGLKKDWTCGELKSKSSGNATAKAADEIVMNATPNPFRERVSVSFLVPASKMQQAQAYTLSLMSSGGSILQSRTLKSLNASSTFDTSKYSTGIYYLMLRGADNRVKSVKVIKIN